MKISAVLRITNLTAISCTLANFIACLPPPPLPPPPPRKTDVTLLLSNQSLRVNQDGGYREKGQFEEQVVEPRTLFEDSRRLTRPGSSCGFRGKKPYFGHQQ